MSIFKIARENDSLENLQEKIIYVTRCTATRLDLIYGSALSVRNAFAEMFLSKLAYQQLNGKSYMHFVLGFEESDGENVKEFYKAGVDIAEFIAIFQGKHQVLMAVHINTSPHFHIHFIVNNIDYLSGERLTLDKRNLYALKNSINQILDKYKFSIIRQNFCYNNDD